jgi:quercetin dioxygenase-like cupin family protein
MKDFPQFMKNPANRIAAASQYTQGIEGYVFDGADGSQVCCWLVHEDCASVEHVHDYDEYMLVVQGQYTLIIGGKRIPLQAGQEYLIKKGVLHGGEAVAGTRTIDIFGGKRARRVGEI